MKTVDSLLPAIANDIGKIKNYIPTKDKRILLSLAKQSNSGVFLTENQANLLVKILKENLPIMITVVNDVENIVDQALWSKSFREIKKIRKIYITPEVPGTFVVEFSFNTRLKEKMHVVNASVKGSIIASGTKNLILLNEENVLLVISTFIKDGFEIDEKLKEFYQEICQVKKTFKAPFDIFTTENAKLKNAVVDDVVFITPENAMMLHDRKMRYQYEITSKIHENTLASKFANRSSRKLFVHTDTTPFVEVIKALNELDRLPMLLVFDGHSSAKDKKTLKMVENALAVQALTCDVGIYFRYDKEADTEKFNQEIAALKYNKPLDANTQVAGISNSKIPKFMIKTEWKPQTVISFTNSFKANKSYVYCNDVDLIVYYGTTQPLDEEVHVIM